MIEKHSYSLVDLIAKEKSNITIYSKNGLIHHDCDEPAIIIETSDGSENENFSSFRHIFCKEGFIYRETGPALMTDVSEGYCTKISSKEPLTIEIISLKHAHELVEKISSHLFFHSKDGPALTVYYENMGKSQFYFTDGLMHREDGPASIRYHENEITEESYYLLGNLHRDEKPAKIIYKNNSIFSEEWYQKGKKHRGNDLAADITYIGDGYKNMIWYHHGVMHRDSDNPTYIKYIRDDKGEFYKREEYFKHGKLHRESGPAFILYQMIDDNSFFVCKQFWCLEGKEI